MCGGLTDCSLDGGVGGELDFVTRVDAVSRPRLERTRVSFSVYRIRFDYVEICQKKLRSYK